MLALTWVMRQAGMVGSHIRRSRRQFEDWGRTGSNVVKRKVNCSGDSKITARPARRLLPGGVIDLSNWAIFTTRSGNDWVIDAVHSALAKYTT